MSASLGNSISVAMKHDAVARERTFTLAAENAVVNKAQVVQLPDESGAESGAVPTARARTKTRKRMLEAGIRVKRGLRK